MTTNTYNIIVKKGDTFNGVSFTISPVIEITSAKMQIKKTSYATDTILELSSDDSTLEIGDSVITIPAQIFNITASNYVYDIQMTLSNGYVKSWISGQFIVKQTVTS